MFPKEQELCPPKNGEQESCSPRSRNYAPKNEQQESCFIRSKNHAPLRIESWFLEQKSWFLMEQNHALPPQGARTYFSFLGSISHAPHGACSPKNRTMVLRTKIIVPHGAEPYSAPSRSKNLAPQEARTPQRWGAGVMLLKEQQSCSPKNMNYTSKNREHDSRSPKNKIIVPIAKIMVPRSEGQQKVMDPNLWGPLTQFQIMGRAENTSLNRGPIVGSSPAIEELAIKGHYLVQK